MLILIDYLWDNMKIDQAVIVVGGIGDRLKPITEKIPKPMIEVRGKPFLYYLIENIKRAGITDIILCSGYKHEIIESYFGDGSKFGIKITYSVEKEPLDTGGAVKLAKKYIGDRFLLVWGDTYNSISYKEFINFSEKIDKLGIILIYTNRDNIAENNITEQDGLVIDYSKLEKHEKIKSVKQTQQPFNAIDAGLYILDKKIFNMFPEKDKFSFELEIIPKLIVNRELACYKTDKRYYDIGTLDRLKTFESYLEEVKK
jgi:NDP-sugar pyrophosphorylase family protein